MAKRSDHVLSKDVRDAMGGDTGPGNASNGNNENHPSASLSSAQGDSTKVVACLRELLSGDDGWLRLTQDGGGKTVYLKWKFTSGRCAGKYVMVVGDASHSFAYLLSTLCDKVDYARVTGLGVSLDKYYQAT